MDHAEVVRIAQRARHVPHDPDRLFHRELLLAVQALPERLALHVRHDVIEQPIGFAGVVERQDVGVGELGRDLDLLEEPPGADRVGQLGLEDLDGHLPPVLHILGEEHCRHAAVAELALDPVSAGKCFSQAGQRVGHRSSAYAARRRHLTSCCL